MLKRIEVTEPPKSAPQYMLDSRMMADTGCIVNVSGSSSDTPLGAPSPGSTPTRMPSSTPATISTRWFIENAISKPRIRSSRFSIASESERRAEHALGQRHLEGAVEDGVQRDGRDDREHEGLHDAAM